MSQRKIRVAVVFGGRSTEHAVSCLGAGHILAAIDRDRYEVVPIGIAPDGRWVLTSDDPDRLAIRGGELPTVDAVATFPGDQRKGRRCRLFPSAGEVGRDVVLSIRQHVDREMRGGVNRLAHVRLLANAEEHERRIE